MNGLQNIPGKIFINKNKMMYGLHIILAPKHTYPSFARCLSRIWSEAVRRKALPDRKVEASIKAAFNDSVSNMLKWLMLHEVHRDGIARKSSVYKFTTCLRSFRTILKIKSMILNHSYKFTRKNKCLVCALIEEDQ